MWWRKASLPALGLLLALSGCGFHPLYGHGNGVSGSKANDNFGLVHISPVDDRLGISMTNALEARMHTEGSQFQPLYRLQIKMDHSTVGINYQKNATASGGETSVTADWQLLDYQTGKRLAHGRFISTDSVNYLGPRYASVAAEQNSQDQAVTDLADMITDRVAVYLSQHPH